MEKVATENRETEFDQYFNYIKDKMTDIADRVDGKTIDYLDNADIRIIKEMMQECCGKGPQSCFQIG